MGREAGKCAPMKIEIRIRYYPYLCIGKIKSNIRNSTYLLLAIQRRIAIQLFSCSRIEWYEKFRVIRTRPINGNSSSLRDAECERKRGEDSRTGSCRMKISWLRGFFNFVSGKFRLPSRASFARFEAPKFELQPCFRHRLQDWSVTFHRRVFRAVLSLCNKGRG